MKKLTGEILRLEIQPGYLKEAWHPIWRCYCCHDTGFIRASLIRLVIKDYQPGKYKYPICQNPGCDAADRKIGEGIHNCLDFRFDGKTCQELDSIERTNWRETLQECRKQRQQRSIPQPPDFSKVVKNLRGGDRTGAEQYEAERRHEEVKER